ncbi:MAG: hypothetical protein HON70_17500, partial [Lentisphaerae bacterium]|nr:hypothetical protein [Lentisphaerota bacterium]
EQTPWCNITRMLYQDSGAILNLSPRYTYREHAPRLQAAFEFATAPDAASVVRTVEVDREPSGLVIVMPPDLATPENAARLKVDRDVAAETGRLADAFDWPQIGRFPTAFPFFAAVRVGGYGHTVSAAVSAREWRTLDYFGFSNRSKPFIHGGIWHCRDGSYCAPDLDRMRAGAAAQADTFRASGRSPAEIAFCMLMDEPQGQPSSFLASDPACIEGFRAWLKALRLEPADLLVENWGDVRPVVQSDRAAFPGLHYYTQRFRTRALGDFLAAQRAVLEEAYGAAFPTLVNFSDGAVYQANMYAMGVDYFELLDCDRQNAIWGEDWANLASTYQCASYNIELMRAAARDRGQMIGHYLIAYAGRTPWDVKLKGVSAVARGVKVLKNFFYGPSWGSHEGGPFWQSSAWYSRPETWRANAELVREIGAVEDMLVPAKPIPADVALLYSSSTDIWTLRGNGAYGFDRMHTWLALAHAQVPVDIVSERQASAGQLHGYRVCYLSGPNLTRRSAAALRDWVRAGGTLWLTAGAGERDEYNRPLELLSDILPARRLELTEFQSHKSAGKFLHTLVGRDTVSAGPVTVEVLSVREVLEPRAGATVSGRYADGRAAMVRGAYGSGSITCVGFLPALAYIKAAECARNALAEPAAADAVPPVPDAVSELLQRSYNPWEFPGAVRELILRPVRQAGVVAPVTCDVPLIDAVAMDCNLGVLLPLANYTLRPLDSVGFSLAAPRRTLRVESVHRGEIPFSTEPDGRIRFELPLAATDFVKVYLAAP